MLVETKVKERGKVTNKLSNAGSAEKQSVSGVKPDSASYSATPEVSLDSLKPKKTCVSESQNTADGRVATQMTKKKSSFEFCYDELLKTSRPNFVVPKTILKASAPDRRLCVFTGMCKYLSKTVTLRTCDSLFISFFFFLFFFFVFFFLIFFIDTFCTQTKPF